MKTDAIPISLRLIFFFTLVMSDTFFILGQCFAKFFFFIFNYNFLTKAT